MINWTKYTYSVSSSEIRNEQCRQAAAILSTRASAGPTVTPRLDLSHVNYVTSSRRLPTLQIQPASSFSNIKSPPFHKTKSELVNELWLIQSRSSSSLGSSVLTTLGRRHLSPFSAQEHLPTNSTLTPSFSPEIPSNRHIPDGSRSVAYLRDISLLSPGITTMSRSTR